MLACGVSSGMWGGHICPPHGVEDPGVLLAAMHCLGLSSTRTRGHVGSAMAAWSRGAVQGVDLQGSCVW